MDDQWAEMKKAMLAGESPEVHNALFGLLIAMSCKLVHDEARTEKIRLYLESQNACPGPENIINWLRKGWPEDEVVGQLVRKGLMQWKREMLELITKDGKSTADSDLMDQS